MNIATYTSMARAIRSAILKLMGPAYELEFSYFLLNAVQSGSTIIDLSMAIPPE